MEPKLAVYPNAPIGYDLIHRGALALAAAQRRGIRVDMPYARKMYKRLGDKLERYRRRLDQTELLRAWRKKYGDNTDLESNDQMADILYNVMGFEAKKLTASGKPSTSQRALETLKQPFVNEVLTYRRLFQARNTFLSAIIKETVRHEKGIWLLHPFFHTHSVQTFRSSSSNINFHNQPKRQKDIMRIIRRCFIPRPGRQLFAGDFSGAEIRMGYCYHKDPNMRAEILDKSKDMHRDAAMKNYCLTWDELGEKGTATYEALRHHGGKNGFIFPEFYGDFYKSCADHMWDDIEIYDLATANGTPLKQHLHKKGIRSYADFEQHVGKVEDWFWGERFPDYNQWRKDWYAEYETKGYFDTLTGFRCQGYMSRNQCINYPVQGSAFHMLLWAFIEIHEELERRNMDSFLLGQIHDEIDGDMNPQEREDVTEICLDVMTKRLPSEWADILVIPLKVDIEFSEIDGSWDDMKEDDDYAFAH
jgi:DNA polymerase-1